MNFVIVDDNNVINLDQVKYFYWKEEEKTLIVAVSVSEEATIFSPERSIRILQICLDKGIPVPKWVIEKYAD